MKPTRSKTVPALLVAFLVGAAVAVWLWPGVQRIEVVPEREPEPVPHRTSTSTVHRDAAPVLEQLPVPPPRALRTERFAGTVVDATGGPVTGARVRVSSLTWLLEQTTDGVGRFDFMVPPTRVRLMVDAQGYADFKSADLDPPRTNVRVSLFPGGSISGRVLGPEGRPAVGVKVYAHSVAFFTALSYIPRGIAWTDALGRFEITDLAPSRYEVGLSSLGVTSVANHEVTLGVGEAHEGLELRSAPAPMVSVTLSGPVCEGARIQLAPTGKTYPTSGSAVGASGRARFNAKTQGAHDVSLRCPGVTLSLGTAFVDSDGAVLERSLPDNLGRLEGQVLTTQGDVVRGAIIRMVSTRGKADTRARDVRTDAFGRFTVSSIPHGRYRLELRHMYPDEPELVEIVVISDALERLTLTVEALSEVAGVVVDTEGKGVEGVKVIAGADYKGAPLRAFRWGSSGPDGRFVIKRLMRGTWSVHAKFPWGARGAEKVSVVLEAGERAGPVRLTTPLFAHRISGHVRSKGGEGLRDVLVTMEAQYEAGEPCDPRIAKENPFVLTDDAGRFVLELADAGAFYTVVAYRPGGAQVVAHDVVAGTPAHMVLEHVGPN